MFKPRKGSLGHPRGKIRTPFLYFWIGCLAFLAPQATRSVRGQSAPIDRPRVVLPYATPQNAYRVKDINTAGPAWELGREIVLDGVAKLGDTIFFGLTDANGAELWRTDGAPDGTSIVKDIPSCFWSRLSQLTAVNELIFFVAVSEGTGAELWRSDGTPAGTFLVKDIMPGQGGSNPEHLTLVGDSLFFTAVGGAGLALWKSDGTAAGTVIVKDLSMGPGAGASASDLMPFGADLFFLLYSGSGQNGLWKSDGSEAGTNPIKEFSGTGPRMASLSASDKDLFFFSHDQPGGRFLLWRSDGSAAGTLPLRDYVGDPARGSYAPSGMTSGGSQLFFYANDPAFGRELWKSDGTLGGTVLVKDIAPGPASSVYFEPPAWIEGTLYFPADDGLSGLELWKSDGTATTTAFVKDINPGPVGSNLSLLTDVGGVLYFVAADSPSLTPYNEEPWRSDGTERGTFMVADVSPGPGGSRPRHFFSLGRDAVFVASEQIETESLWRTDGTLSGTSRLKMISPGNGNAMPACLMGTEAKLFFGAAEDRFGTGRNLWETDGTESGTRRVRSFRYFSCPAAVGSSILFGASDDINGTALWKSDGTFESSVLIQSFPALPENLTSFNGTAVFTIFAPLAGTSELWKTDGTPAGTIRLRSFFPDLGPVSDLTVAARKLFFRANDGIHGPELWATDGTETGTVLVKDTFPAFGTVGPGNLTAVNGQLYFTVEHPWFGGPLALFPPVELFQLWKSDGTAEGTVLVRDFSVSPPPPRSLTGVEGTLFFRRGAELWRSNGTADTTVLVKTFPEDQLLPALDALTSFRGMVFFVAQDEAHGRELWRSDGTLEGTVIVRDINPGPEGSSLMAPSVVDGVLLFAANDGLHGIEIWETDGTPSGTALLHDVVPGPASSNSRAFMRWRSRLYFVAEDRVSGRELWALPDSGISRSRTTRLVPFRGSGR